MELKNIYFLDIARAVDASIQNFEEGVMLKDLKEPYKPNERAWVKIKPDYLSGVGDNLDLVKKIFRSKQEI